MLATSHLSDEAIGGERRKAEIGAVPPGVLERRAPTGSLALRARVANNADVIRNAAKLMASGAASRRVLVIKYWSPDVLAAVTGCDCQ
jgi:hypothetical protein